MVTDSSEPGFLNDDIVKGHLLAGHSINLRLAIEVFIILVILLVVDERGLGHRECAAHVDVGCRNGILILLQSIAVILIVDCGRMESV